MSPFTIRMLRPLKCLPGLLLGLSCQAPAPHPDSGSPRVEIIQGQLQVNGKPLSLPCSVTALEQLFGPSTRSAVQEDILIWDEPGFFAYRSHHLAAQISTLTFPLVTEPLPFAPKQPFSGQLWLDGARVLANQEIWELQRDVLRAQPDDALQTTRPGVFACGDAVSGPATVVGAVAQGNQVAQAVDHWLQTGQAVRPIMQAKRHDFAQTVNLDDYADAERPLIPLIPVAHRLQGDAFQEVETGFDRATAQAEAARCLRCDLEWLQRMKLPLPQREFA